MEHFFDILNKLNDLYVSYRGRYVVAANGQIFIPQDKHTGHPRPLISKVLCAHLNQRFAVGVYAGPLSSKFVCFDVDLADEDVVHRLIDGIEEFGFPRDRIYVSSSGGKGFHVEIFFSQLMYTKVLLCFYHSVIQRLGLDPKKVEFRPTHGQSIKLPLSVHHKTGNVCWYLDRETQEPIRSQDFILSIETVDRDWAANLIRKKADMEILWDERLEKDDGIKTKAVDFTRVEDELPMMTGPGMRNSMMVSIAIHDRYAGMTADEIERRLLAWVEEQRPEYITDPEKIVRAEAKKIADWVCSEKFKVSLGEKNIRIADIDKETICSQRTKIRRRVLFLIFLFTKKHGSARLTLGRIAEFVSCTKNSVLNAINALEEAGVISVKKGKKHYTGGAFVAACNSYVYIRPEGKALGEIHAVNWDYRPETFMEVMDKTFGGKEK